MNPLELPPVPQGSVDCHVHVYDDRYPSALGAKLLPPNALLEDYLQLQARMGIERFVLVTPSTYGTDNSLVLDVLRQRKGLARGIVVLDDGVSDQALCEMDALGVRGVRFNLTLGGAGLELLETTAQRIAPLGWHIQIVADGQDLLALEARLSRLPTPLVIDHMGHVPQPAGVNSNAFGALERMLGNGRTWVKLSGPYIRSLTGAPSYEDVASIARTLLQNHTDRLLWGSDWPHPMAKAPKPDACHLLSLLAGWMQDASEWEKVLRRNPVQLYGF